MLSKLMIGGIIGGIILFIWSAVSWMALPWHKNTLHKFNNNTAVMQTIQANAPQSGIYLSPMETSDTKSPMIFASIDLKNMPTSMLPEMGISLLFNMVAALLVTWMLLKTKGLNYFERVGFVLIFALTVGIVAYLPYWNWFRFETNFTLVQLADLMIGWFFAGLFLAKITNRSP